MKETVLVQLDIGSFICKMKYNSRQRGFSTVWVPALWSLLTWELLLCPGHSNSKQLNNIQQVTSPKEFCQTNSLCRCHPSGIELVYSDTNHHWGRLDMRLMGTQPIALLCPGGAGTPQWHRMRGDCEVPLYPLQVFRKRVVFSTG